MKTTEENRGRMLLQAAANAWNRMADLRQRRRRNCRFTYGDQWSDTVRDRRGRLVTERDAATRNGHQPMTNNLIRRLVKAVIGRWRMERLENPDAARAADPQGINRLDELDARTLEEFLISGMAVHRVCRERRITGDGVWADNISPDRFFVNAFSDPRGCDLEMAGCLRDMSMSELIMRFSASTPETELRRIYADTDGAPSLFDTPDSHRQESFFHAPAGRCRVVEVWTLECRRRLLVHDPLEASLLSFPVEDAPKVRRMSARRVRRGMEPLTAREEMTTLWRCRCLAPDGTVLDSFDSPLPGGALPYAIKMYPMVDGDVHSLVEDILDQQKFVNRIITMLDHIMGVSAKGALLFPTQCRVEKFDWDVYANLWSEPGAIIPYRACDGQEPHQITAPASDLGAREMLQTQIQLFEDISGVNSALMGKDVSGAVGAERYSQEIRNSAVSILDLLQSFADFTAARDRLMAMA